MAELNKKPTMDDFDLLFKFGGFPEPCYYGAAAGHRLVGLGAPVAAIRNDARIAFA